jgi:hypothetical protein
VIVRGVGRLATGVIVLAALGCASSAKREIVELFKPGEVHLHIEVASSSCTVFFVSDDRMNGLPDWDPSASPLPSPLSDFVSAAREKFLELHPDAEDAELRSVEVDRAPSCEMRNKWFLKIAFNALPVQSSGFRDDPPVIMLLDGTFAESRTNPSCGYE